MFIATVGYVLVLLLAIGLFVDTESSPAETQAAVEPTATTATDGVDTYVADAGRINRSVVNALNELATLGDDPSSADWRLDIDVPTGMLQLGYLQAQQLNPPGEHTGFHDNWLAALALLDEAAGLITDGLDTENDALIHTAGAKIDEAAEMMRTGPQLP